VRQIQFVRFECADGCVTAFRYATDKVSLDYCPACGQTDVEQIESQYIDADIEGDTSSLNVEVE